MDWQALGTFVALIGVIASFALTLRGQNQERRLAENSASRSEAAARLTEEYAAQVVAALQELAAKGGQDAAYTAPAAVRWSLSHSRGDTYVLENQGSAAAYDVEVTGHESLIGPDRYHGDLGRVGPGEAITFMAVLVMGTSDTTITVTWADEQESTDRRTWRYPLPAKPRK